MMYSMIRTYVRTVHDTGPNACMMYGIMMLYVCYTVPGTVLMQVEQFSLVLMILVYCMIQYIHAVL